MSLDQWAAIGVVCGAILGAAAVCFLLARGIRRMWHLMRKVNRLLDQTLGSPGRPSLMDRVTSIEEKLEEHLHWHTDPRGRPAGGAPLQPNGPRRGRRPNE